MPSVGTPRIIFSSINVAETPQFALRSPEWLGDFARGAGYDGVEYMPVFDLLPGHTPRAIARAMRKNHIDINSYHATFREGSRSRQTNKLPGDPENSPSLKGKLLNSAVGRLILPEVHESASVIGATQRLMNQTKPVVLYPQRVAKTDRRLIKDSRTDTPLFQPTDHVARLFGAESLEQFQDASARRGFGYVWDTFHARRRYGHDEKGVISDTSTSLPALAPKTTAIHLSLHRTDIPGESHIPTQQEAVDAVEGFYTGGLATDLTILREQGKVDYVVVEATLGGIAAAAEVTQLDDIQKAYASVAEGFRAFWAREL